MEHTTIGLTRDAVERLRRSGFKGETYDEIVKRLLESRAGRGIVAADEPWSPLMHPDLGLDGRRLVMAVRHGTEVRDVLKKLQRGGSLKEQWTAPIGLVPPAAGRLRNYIIVSEKVVGAAGDTVSVPYVKDFDLDILEEPGVALTPKTDLMGVVETTLKEAAATTDVDYSDLEKMSAEILTALEGQFVQASYRAEDKQILDTLYAEDTIPELDKSADSPAAFPASYIAQALAVMGGHGKTISAGDCVLICNWQMYEDIVRDIAATQSLAYVAPDTVRSGILPTLIGVTVVAVNYLPSGGDPECYSAYLLHHNAVVLAPKRELLIETDKRPQERKMSVTGSHTFGSSVLEQASDDMSAAMEKARTEITSSMQQMSDETNSIIGKGLQGEAQSRFASFQDCVTGKAAGMASSVGDSVNQMYDEINREYAALTAAPTTAPLAAPGPSAILPSKLNQLSYVTGTQEAPTTTTTAVTVPVTVQMDSTIITQMTINKLVNRFEQLR
jgi:hypothetical protein